MAQALIRLGPGARPALVEALSHDNPAERAVAVEVLGLTGAVETARALVGVLAGDSSDDVRVRAVRALGRLGTPVCLDALIHATGPAHPQAVRVEAATALGDLGSPGPCRRCASSWPTPTTTSRTTPPAPWPAWAGPRRRP
nr:hypothetical protein GCM10020093_118200 [Planobispora longispora]BFE89457.1 hypothetical protein GCM10020093_120590 [Planobispora longispora]